MPDFIHLPEPMSPPDCDLRGNQWLPFHGARLFSSDFDATASDAVFRAFMYLIWAAWNQVPAGSLPNIPAVLCKLSGCGRDLAAWEALRAGGVLHGFILCQDDRLYHPFLCAEAIKSFDARLKADKKREADRERLRLWREAKEKKRTTSQSGNVFQGHIETPVETSKTRPDQTRPVIYPNPADSGAEAPPPAYPDLRTQAWREGKQIVATLTGQPDREAGAFVGKIAGILKQDFAALIAILHEAQRIRPLDPTAWMIGAANARVTPKATSHLAKSAETARSNAAKLRDLERELMGEQDKFDGLTIEQEPRDAQ